MGSSQGHDHGSAFSVSDRKQRRTREWFQAKASRIAGTSDSPLSQHRTILEKLGVTCSAQPEVRVFSWQGNIRDVYDGINKATGPRHTSRQLYSNQLLVKPSQTGASKWKRGWSITRSCTAGIIRSQTPAGSYGALACRGRARRAKP